MSIEVKSGVRKSRTTIEEKIDRLIEFVKKYPQLRKFIYTGGINDAVYKVLQQSSRKNRKKLIELLKTAKEDYTYIRIRKSRGKLKKEHLIKLKEAGIGGVFGENAKVEKEVTELVNKTGIKPHIVDFIIKKYGSIDEFRKIYVKALIDNNVEEVIPKKILDNVNLINQFDLNSLDLINRNNAIIELIKDITNYNSNVYIIDGTKIDEFLDEIIKKLPNNESNERVFKLYYGFNGHGKKNYTQIAKESDGTIETIRKKVTNKLNKMRKSVYIREKLKEIYAYMDYDSVKEFINKYFEYFDVFQNIEPVEIGEDVRKELISIVYEGIEKKKKRDEQIEIIKLMPKEQRKRIIKESFGEKIDYKKLKLLNPSIKRDIKKRNKGTIINIDEEYSYMDNLYLEEEIIRETLDSEYTKSLIKIYEEKGLKPSRKYELGFIEELGLSIKVFNKLKQVGINTIYELINTSPNDIKQIKHFGKISYDELLEKVHLFGLKFKFEYEQEQYEKNLDNESEYSREAQIQYKLGLNIEQLGLSNRAYNCLRRAGINTVSDLINKSEEEIINIKNLGWKSYIEVIEKIHLLGLKLKSEYENEQTEMDTDITEESSIEDSENKNKKATILLNLIKNLQSAYLKLERKERELQILMEENIIKPEKFEKKRGQIQKRKENLYKQLSDLTQEL